MSDGQGLVNQEGNNVAGDMAGRDLTRVSHTTILQSDTKTPLKIMAEKYRRKIEQDCVQQEFIEELQDYMKRVPGHEQRDLEHKLSAAKRDDLIANAKRLKEKFAKKLYKHTFSPMAQKIFVQILSIINSSFHLKIKPMIRENKSSRLVDNAIYDEIVNSVYSEVGNSELEIDMDHIHGMLYYLTGNCYIEWEK